MAENEALFLPVRSLQVWDFFVEHVVLIFSLAEEGVAHSETEEACRALATGASIFQACDVGRRRVRQAFLSD